MIRNTLIAGSAVVAIAGINFLQGKFDQADRRAALNVVHAYRAKGGYSIPELLDERHPKKPVLWAVETESSCSQHERVKASVDGKTYLFMVDINGPSIHPGNPDGKAILGDLDRQKPAPPASASASIGAPASAAPAAPPAPSASSSAGAP